MKNLDSHTLPLPAPGCCKGIQTKLRPTPSLVRHSNLCLYLEFHASLCPCPCLCPPPALHQPLPLPLFSGGSCLRHAGPVRAIRLRDATIRALHRHDDGLWRLWLRRLWWGLRRYRWWSRPGRWSRPDHRVRKIIIILAGQGQG